MPSRNLTGYHELDPSSAPQLYLYNDDPQVSDRTTSLPEVISRKDVAAVSSREKPLPEGSKSNRKRNIILIAIACVLVLAAVGGGLGGYFAHRIQVQNQSISSPTSSPLSDGPATTTSTTPTPSSPGGGTGSPTGGFNPAFALNGTSLATLTYSPAPDRDPTQQNYVVFYQHSSGDIRKTVYNQSAWYPSELVVRGAAPGTGICAIMMLPSIHIYYVDSFGYLQETRGHHASNDWFNGTLGDARIKAVPLSALGSAYAGACTDRGGFGFVYFTALDHTLHQATWAQDNDLWVDKGSTSDFPDMRFDADYTATTDGGTFRMYGITHGLQIQEYVCPQCCQNSSATWQQGLTGTSVTDSSLRLCMSGVGGPRYLYYPDPTAQMRELINTGNQDGDGAPENWQDYIANLTTQSPLSGEPVGQAMRGSKMSMSAGFRGKTQQLWMFYQAEGSDVSVRIRDVPKPGQWSERVALPVGV